MNALHKLSTQYFKREITQQDYRNRRKFLIESILDGQYAELNSITNVPFKAELEITQQGQEFKVVLDAQPKANIRSKQSTFRCIAVLVLSLCFLGFIYRDMLFQKLTQYAPAVAEVISALKLQGSAEQNAASQITSLTELWQQAISTNQLTEKNITLITSLWHQTSFKEREEFAALLRQYVKRWESEFDKEIEVSLTNRIMQILDIQP
ncbi:hypothetical protein [Rheinheimera maricola]|uniref:Uncharacterized protein n=1 Tax=Rheinheimera maricola TaxID=2793282 RepID=A0ABS7XD32_9GAMM|nr:hypothetical protein [Rheinheimera maricola]MBZ9613441.1 hypothetical protein [Rheinheimera maricola]